MIGKREFFSIKGKCIVEKLRIDHPGRMAVDFPDEACYLYLRHGGLVVNGIASTTRMAARDGFVLNCGSYFADFISAAPETTSEVFAIHLYPDLLSEIFRTGMPSFLRSHRETRLPGKTIRNAVMDRFMESLLFYFDNPEIVTEEILTLKVRELILLLVQSEHAENIHALFASMFTRRSVSVADVVNAHLYDNLSVKELAKLAGLSLTAFKVEFGKVFNESPARYIRMRKIERAKELLRISDCSIGEIACKVGYDDLSHFSKSFQHLCGCSPGEFRDQLRSQRE